MSAGDHVVKVTPARKVDLPDVFRLTCTCGWYAEANGVENARRAAQAHADRRSDGAS